MSAIYDNWERLVAAVLKKEQLWVLFHSQSRSTSISSGSSDFSFSFCLASSLEDERIASLEWSVFHQQGRDNTGGLIGATPNSSILVEDQLPVKSFSPRKNDGFVSRKRNLKIQVPKLQIHQDGAFTFASCSKSCPNVSPRMQSPRSPSSSVHPTAEKRQSENHWPNYKEKRSHPLPLPPKSNSDLSPFSCKSHGSEIAENFQSQGTIWKKGKWIDGGSFWNIYVCFNSNTGQMCLMKEVSLSTNDAKSINSASTLEKEIELLSRLKHPNIMQYYGSEKVGDKVYIYFEYVSGGRISAILQEFGNIGETAIRSYTRQVLCGLAYLHHQRITHGDIKAANILLDPTGRVKLVNFGITKNISALSWSSSHADGPSWMAPEAILCPNNCNSAVDIWSLGRTIIEMMTSKPPLSQYETDANRKELPSIPNHLSSECKDFLRHCLQWNPMDRATASQLLEHPFVQISSPWERREMDYVRNHQLLGSRRLADLSARDSKFNFHAPNESFSPTEISPPISPVTTLLYPLPIQQPKGQISPSPLFVYNPRTPLGMPTPPSSQIGASPYLHPNQSTPQLEMLHNSRKQSPSLSTPCYWDPNILRGWKSGARSDALQDKFLDDGIGPYEQLILAARLCQELPKDPVKLKQSRDRNPSPLVSIKSEDGDVLVDNKEIHRNRQALPV